MVKVASEMIFRHSLNALGEKAWHVSAMIFDPTPIAAGRNCNTVSFMLLKQADFLIKELRRGLKTYLEEAKIRSIGCNEQWLREKRGAFVTLKGYPENELRGCIGYIEPVYPLGEIAMRAAIAAALEDPRFAPLSAGELKKVVMELSVLGIPQQIKAQPSDKLIRQINIGRDGLIVRQGLKQGLLLPQVAIEHKINGEEFLAHCCIKAGLPPGAWTDPSVNVLKFQAEVFSEESPGGKVWRL